MEWLFFALLGPFLWGLTNFVDKYIVGEEFEQLSTGGYMILLGFTQAIIMVTIIILFVPISWSTDINTKIIAIGAGFSMMFSWLLYFEAIKIMETSSVIIQYQMSSVFSYIWAIILLGEVLAVEKLLGAGVVILGFMQFVGLRKVKISRKGTVIMIGACILWSLNVVLFKKVALDHGFWETFFWEYIGFGLSSLLLLLITKYREGFKKIWKRKKILQVAILNEIVGTGGTMSVHWATLLGPVALVTVVGNSFQPVFVLVLGIAGSLLLPKYIKEKIKKKYILQKITAIIIMTIGVTLITI